MRQFKMICLGLSLTLIACGDKDDVSYSWSNSNNGGNNFNGPDDTDDDTADTSDTTETGTPTKPVILAGFWRRAWVGSLIMWGCCRRN